MLFFISLAPVSFAEYITFKFVKTLVIGRHAKSDWSVDAGDFDRPLNKRGKKDAPLIGNLLDKYQYVPELIVSSPAKRAKATAKLLAKELDYHDEPELDYGLYTEGVEFLLEKIRLLDNDLHSVMFIGHNPIMEDTVQSLLQMRSGVVLPTCGLVCMDIHVSDWKEVSAEKTQLRWFLIPRMIKALLR